MPWQSVADCISNDDFRYRPSSDVVETFESETGLRWDNIDESSDATVICAHCFSPCSVPWTTCGSLSSNEKLSGQPQSPTSLADKLSRGTGYADKEFIMQCSNCTLVSDHDALCVGKFLRDVTRLLDKGALMPGTLLNRKGLLEKPWKEQDPSHLCTFPSRLLDAGLGRNILIYCKGADNLQMAKIRAYIEEGLKDKKLMQKARNSPAWRMLRDERVSIRRMMSRYWENSSPFALDLVGAVTRQGSFIEKMHDIDWLHSPALPGTMKRLVIKYTRFVTIMKDSINMAVPTLDVDLAWHTHQLNPLSYLEYTVKQTGQFVDHDDKVAETKLTDAFAWTSKTYQKLFNEPYSECTCWYCEAIRESHTSTASRMFRTSSAAVSDSLHQESKDPRKSVHISAHNAVRPTDGRGLYKHYANVKANELEKHYQKACARAEKKGRTKPRRDDYYYSDAWGYPLYLPAMMPYYGMGMYNPGMYPVNPGCMALGAGAVGNCCSGTCGGTVAAGGAACAGGASSAACGGGIGGTVGACGGGSGFSGGGNCGGGGGGGCGGGGGGGCGGGKSSQLKHLYIVSLTSLQAVEAVSQLYHHSKFYEPVDYEVFILTHTQGNFYLLALAYLHISDEQISVHVSREGARHVNSLDTHLIHYVTVKHHSQDSSAVL